MRKVEPFFGEPTCMMCGEICELVEFINDPLEMWCYCKECKMDTFHKPENLKDLKNIFYD